MRLKVRRCIDTDLIEDLDNKIFPEDLPITASMNLWWVAYWNDKPVGFAGLSYAGDLIRAGVLKRYRGRGIQRRLLTARIREARWRDFQILNTHTSVDNIPSMRNLTRAGFLPTEQEDGFISWSREL